MQEGKNMGIMITLKKPTAERTMRGGGAQGTRWCGAAACVQASQWGLWVRPGKGFGTRGRLRDGGMRSGGRETSAASLLGQAACNMQHSQSRPNSTNW